MTIDQSSQTDYPETGLEESICPHLRTKRTLPKSTPDNYNPPFPAFSSRFTKEQTEFVMAIIGVQSHQGCLEYEIMDKVIEFMKNDLIEHWDLCSFQDFWDKENRCVIVYWNSKKSFEKWKEESGFNSWWDDTIIKNCSKDNENGWYFEQFMPSLDRFETVFSDSKAKEGFSKMEIERSGQIEEHAYWGSMRDRLPKAQTDLLENEKEKGGEESYLINEYKIIKGFTEIEPHQNLCIIRSGQDFKSIKGKEREMYLKEIHPTLIKGMNFLRDDKASENQINCFDCRFMKHINSNDDFDEQFSIDKTFGFAFFKNLKDLEFWSKNHSTHLNIFGKFLNYAKEFNGQINLKLFHDVMVLSTDQQSFQYVNCHNATGMMVKLKPKSYV